MRFSSPTLRLLLAAATASAASGQYDWFNYYSTDPEVASYVQPGGLATDPVSGASCVTGSFQ